MALKTIEWVPDGARRRVPGRVRLVDQTKLPEELVYLETKDVRELWTAIRELKVRGAPAIGVAAAMGVALAAQASSASDTPGLLKAVVKGASYLAGSRPTAVNLFNMLERMKKVAAGLAGLPPDRFREALAKEAQAIRDEDAAMCRAIGRHGLTLLRDGFTVLTHCNAGGLATAEYGTALAPVYLARERGWKVRVFADETRPLLQGARLTAWELMQAGVDVTLICDNMAASVMAAGKIDAVLVGADRIAANGDTANKIGTYSLAVLAAAHEIPLYVLAPTTTFDPAIPDGRHIPIEHRPAEEVTEGMGRRTAPRGVKVHSPAFDVTPASLVRAIVCERGIARPPYTKSLAGLLKSGASAGPVARKRRAAS
ncbi:MAG TPA: S-methyl-5-thioribose-1-phosphate isomerase [Kiritimatiellia bacterium]|nr:S-methyl-5-thioribose-1-phosphate isomerase [Kiritimatiellia bacterium]HSA18461.1 S-methyl-5-thioribose-1-phosphate isomerase [Kiritimatiellia bacterium]